MYFTYGWLRMYAVLPDASSESQDPAVEPATPHRVVSLHMDNDYLVIITTVGVQIWAGGRNRLKLGELVRDQASLLEFGPNINGLWSPSRRQIATLICVPVEHTEHVCSEMIADSRTIVIGAAEGVLHAFTWHGKLRGTVTPLPPTVVVGAPSAPAALSAPLGSRMPSAPGPRNRIAAQSTPLPAVDVPADVAVVSMDYAAAARHMAILLRDGRLALCRVADEGLHPVDLWGFDRWLLAPASGAVCVRLSAAGQLAAVGMDDGSVQLHSLLRGVGGCLRVLSLLEWGHGPASTGRVQAMQCISVPQVGFARAGLVVWSPSGCRLLCSLRQSQALGAQGSMTGAAPASPTRGQGSLLKTPQGCCLPLEAPVEVLAWAPHGHQLLLCESSAPRQLMELSFAKALAQGHRIQHSMEGGRGEEEPVHVLQGDDRLLLIREGSSRGGGGASGLSLQHLLVPHDYLAANYPIASTALSADGADIAVAGRHGMALYSRRAHRWRMFGDVGQERDLQVLTLVWLPKVVAAVARVASATDGAAAHIVIYPRYHLDNASRLAMYPLASVPSAVDAVGNYLLLACAPLDLTLLHVQLTGPLSPAAQPRATLTVARELSILSVGRPLRDIALVAPLHGAAAEPRSCVLLRAGGGLSVLDMAQGSEVVLSQGVECFWLPSAPVWAAPDVRAGSRSALRVTRTMHIGDEALPNGKPPRAGAAGAAPPQGAGADAKVLPPLRVQRSDSLKGQEDGQVEMPWWMYGPKGMQLLFASTLVNAPPTSPTNPGIAATPQDPELEFDQEVYPVGVSVAEVAIVGVTQRTVRSKASGGDGGELPCFNPLPESQPVLPCLLRRLLQQGKPQEALTLARAHSRAPHFARSMEWLLFTTLEMDAERFMQAMAKQKRLGTRLSLQADRVPLVTAAAQLLRRFPQHFADITVRVARKTDSVLWPILFEAAGPPSGALSALEAAGALQSAACCLIIVDNIEGAAVAHAAALRLIRAALDASSYGLVAELMRFLLPPGEADAILAHVQRPAVQAAEEAPVLEPKGSSWLSWLWGGGAEPAQDTPAPTLPSTMTPRSASSAEVVAQAWAVVGRHSWRLLETGRLREVVELGTVFAHMGQGLQGLLVTALEGGTHEPTDVRIMSALAMADTEFVGAKDGDAGAMEAAVFLLEALKGVRLQVATPVVSMWLAALAVVLEDMGTLAAVRDADRELWNRFATVVIEDAQFEAHANVVRLIHLDGLVESRLSVGALKFLERAQSS